MSFFEFPHTRTYDSDLGWLIKEVEKLSTAEDEYKKYVTEWIEQHEKDYAELLTRVNTLQSEMQNFENEINQRFETLESELEQYIYQQVQQALAQIIVELGAIEAEILDLRSDVTLELLEIRGLIDAKDTLTREWVEARLQQFINELPDLENVIVWNPIKGKETTINQALSDLYSISRTDGLTAEEYDSMELEAGDYDSLDLTAWEYDTYAKATLGRWGIYKNPLYYMCSPFSGEYVPITTVINQLASFHMDEAITAGAYDAKEITAGDYDALDLTAYNYDFHATALLP